MLKSLPCLVLAAAAAAQPVIVPSSVASARPSSSPFYASFVFYASTSVPADSRSQSIYDVSDIAPPSAIWTSLEVRRPVGLGNANNAFTANATIVLSMAPNPSSSAQANFAGNHGSNPITVLTGPIALPARANQGSWPAPWEMPIPFTMPFPYVAALGQSVVVDITQTGNTGGTAWYLEATYPDTGARASNPSAQSSCRFSNGNYNNTISYRRPVRGGTWFVNYQNVLPNTVGFGALGTAGVGGTWNGLPLPIDLGVLGAAGCSWNVSVELLVPLTSDASGRCPWPTLNIPDTRHAAGRVFYDHALLLDTAANAAGLVTTWSSKWTIGTGQGAPAASVYAVGASAGNASGSVAQGTVVSMRLQ